MNTRSEFPELKAIDTLAERASALGYEIVDIAGSLDLVDANAKAQRAALGDMQSSAGRIHEANTQVCTAANGLRSSAASTFKDVQESVTLIRDMGRKTRSVAEWVQDVGNRTGSVSDTLRAVKSNNTQIASIAMQVNTLAINAKIEAARAGDAGRGFAVVAEAINSLSQQTKTAAEQITDNVEMLGKWIALLSREASDISQTASDVLSDSDKTDSALGRMETSLKETHTETEMISNRSEESSQATDAFRPHLDTLEVAVTQTSQGISEAHQRIEKLIDTSESIVQSTASLGGTTEDAPFIEYVRKMAALLSEQLDQAIAEGRISEADLFDQRYQPIPGTNPEQVMTRFTKLFDGILPAIQEPALEFSDKVVFCAAVDQNGYLPTHNRKFSQAQGKDPVWNTANCRNRRIFDDRVGLKAGRNTQPFLLQVYRRDMGGGEFVMMKDLSAPIHAAGKHWGGLRFAYKF